MKTRFDPDEACLATFRELCARRWGFHYGERDAFALRTLVERAYQASPASSVDSFAKLLDALPDTAPEVQAFIGQMVVGETSFFRNEPQFDALARRMLPELIAARRAAGDRRLRMWSAGCSTGEEPYSLAILVSKMIPDWRAWDVTIYATDINPYALRRAEDAAYSDWSFRNVDDDFVAGYFERSGSSRRLTHPCRSMVKFSRQNLVGAQIPDPRLGLAHLDVILCRNVTIYFEPGVTRRLASGFFDALAPGGWLVVGHTEPDAEIYAQFELVEFPDTIVYRRGMPALASHPYAPATGAALAVGEALHDERGPVAGASTSLTVGGALAAYEARDLTGAAATLVRIHETSVDDATPAHLLAQISADEKRYDEALYWAFCALQRDPFHVPTLLLMGLIHLEAGEAERAKDYFQQAVFLDSRCPEAHFFLSLALRSIGNDGRADSELRRAERLGREAADAPSSLLPVQRARQALRAS